MTTSTTDSRPLLLPSGLTLVGLVYAVTVVCMAAFFAGEILFTDKDPHANDGPIESLLTVLVVGTVALVIGLVVALTSLRTTERARVGAFILAGLAVLTIPIFWSGTPGLLGACAAWCAGINRREGALTGPARAAGIVGVLIALMNVVLSIAGVVLTPLFG